MGEAAGETWTTKDVVADLKQDLVGHLNKQDETLSFISAKLDQKADKTDLVTLWGRIDNHDGRITMIETERKAERRWRSRAWIIAGGATTIAGGILAALIEAHAL